MGWRPPEGMTGEIKGYDGRIGGGYRMKLFYADAADPHGKTAPGADILSVRFVELAPDERIVEAVRFETDDPAFQGEMLLTTTLTPVSDGTKVAFAAEQVPPGISAADHRVGMESTLKRLASFVE